MQVTGTNIWDVYGVVCSNNTILNILPTDQWRWGYGTGHRRLSWPVVLQ